LASSSKKKTKEGKIFERSNKKRPSVSPGDHFGGKARQGVGNKMKQNKTGNPERRV
jgi:hypothetical protein